MPFSFNLICHTGRRKCVNTIKKEMPVRICKGKNVFLLIEYRYRFMEKRWGKITGLPVSYGKTVSEHGSHTGLLFPVHRFHE
jgi:hypothetical protein